MAPAANPTLSEDHVNPEIEANDGTVVSATDANRLSDVDQPEGSHLVDRDYYNAQDGTRGRHGGVYLDMQERVDAEETRAMSEGRKPDYDNPPASVGTSLVTDAYRVDNTYSNPSTANVAPVDSVDPVSTLPTDIGVGTTTVDTSYQDQVSAENGDNPPPSEPATPISEQENGEPVNEPAPNSTSPVPSGSNPTTL